MEVVGKFSGNPPRLRFEVTEGGIAIHKQALETREDVDLVKVPANVYKLMLSKSGLNNDSLTAMARFSQLRYLDISGNRLITTLDAYYNGLTQLNISGTSIARISLGCYKRLESLNIYNIYPIAAFELPGDLKNMLISREQLFFIDFTGKTVYNLAIAAFDKEIDITEKIKTRVSIFEYQQLQFTDLHYPNLFFPAVLYKRKLPPRLVKLVARYTGLCAVDLAELRCLEVLDVQHNPFYTEDSSFPDSLVELNMDNCGDAVLQCPNCANLQRVFASGNSFKRLEITCYGELVLRESHQLRRVAVHGTPSKLDVCNSFRLEKLLLPQSLTSINISKTALVHFDASPFVGLYELIFDQCRLKLLIAEQNIPHISCVSAYIAFFCGDDKRIGAVATQRFPAVCRALLRMSRCYKTAEKLHTVEQMAHGIDKFLRMLQYITL